MSEENPLPEPFNTFRLDVGDGHTLYVEESGNPHGLPLISFHGGPGSHSKPKRRLSYDLEKFRLILFDQRHCGQSTPPVSAVPTTQISHNPADIVADADKIRQHLGLDSWHVTGGSWGSAMALLYAVTYPPVTRSLTLRALFLGQESDWGWMATGCRLFNPPGYAPAVALFPGKEGIDLLMALADQILSNNRAKALAATKALINLEHGLEILTPPPNDEPAKTYTEDDLLNGGLLYAHVVKHHLFPDGWAMTRAAQVALEDKPLSIIHGACDASCLIKNVYDIKAAHPHAELFIASNAGHGVDLNGEMDLFYSAALDKLS